MELEKENTNDKTLHWLKQPGSQLIVINNLPDEETEKADPAIALLHQKLNDVAEELERLSGEKGVTITVKTILMIDQGEITNG